MDTIAEPTRRAALLLHALSGTDREWILERLPGHAQTTLRSLLRELRELGIPADRELIASVATHAQAAPALEQADLSVAQLCRIAARTDPARLAVLLGDEPPQLIAGFVQLYDWPWREQFIGALGPLRRKQVSELLMTGDPHKRPPRERAASRYLLNAIIERIGDQGSDDAGRGSVPDRATRTNRWLARLAAPLRGGRAA